MNRNNKNRNRWVVQPTFDIDYVRWSFRCNRKGVLNLGRMIKKALNQKEDDNN